MVKRVAKVTGVSANSLIEEWVTEGLGVASAELAAKLEALAASFRGPAPSPAPEKVAATFGEAEAQGDPIQARRVAARASGLGLRRGHSKSPFAGLAARERQLG